MNHLPSFLMPSRLLPPDLIWLEPEQIAQAKTMSERVMPEAQQWQSYLNALALLSFEQWLGERLPEQLLTRLTKPIESVGYVEVNGFKFCLIAVEHVLNETVPIPQPVVEQPEFTAHFYVVQEVAEEQALVTLRGCLRFDELMHYRDRYQPQDHCYQFPLALLDVEPNHLLFYCRSLQPAAIALPVSAAPTVDRLSVGLTSQITKLGQWLQAAVDENWSSIELLINPTAALALSSRSMELGAKRGKLINLGVQLGSQTVALLVNVTAAPDGKLSVVVQLHPTGSARYLVSDLQLSLRSATGKPLQAVVSRTQDNYIQLKPFKGDAGTQFSVAIGLGSETVEENFEL